MYRPIIERPPLSDLVVCDNPVLNRVLQNRGISSKDEISYSLRDILDFSSMRDIDVAAMLIRDAVIEKKRIMILGDFDCDGATSTTIMFEGLCSLGASEVRFMVPHRMKHGYGLTPKVVREFSGYDPELLITVDNGIAAFEGIDAVRNDFPECKILVTDHHLSSDRGRPDADCIVDPCQDGCDFPSKNIAGCGVAFYTIMAARSLMDKKNDFSRLGIDKPSLARLLDVLSLGTVADVVALDKNNRTIVDAGLRMINSGLCRPGIRAILEIKNKEIGKIEASDFGFAVGPCLNAAGRLEDMTIGIRCLLETDEYKARKYAEELCDLNEKRKNIESEMKEEAEYLIDESESQFGFVIYNPSWHEGVVGIVASRVKDATNRPSICMTNTEAANEILMEIEKQESLGASELEISQLRQKLDDCAIKGSARSVEGIHIKHLIDKIAKSNGHIFLGYGGHAMAAGLSIYKKYLHEFQALFDQYVEEEMTDEILAGKIEVDIKELPAMHITMDNSNLFKQATPWGQKFEEPTFSGIFTVISKKTCGKGGNHVQVQLMKDGQVFKGIAFNSAKDGVCPFGDIVEVVYKLSINEFRGKKTLQLMVSHIQDYNNREDGSYEFRTRSDF